MPPGGDGHLWKLVRTFDDPATWTEPGVRHLAADGAGGPQYRTEPLDDQWELYDLNADPIEAANLAPDRSDPAAVFTHLRMVLKEQRAASVPERNEPWPYAVRQPSVPDARQPPPPARLLRRLVQRLGMHPEDTDPSPELNLVGRRALIVCTNHGWLDIGKPTGVFASEMTVPYYAFLDAGMDVDLASPEGGLIPVDPMSLKPIIRSASDDRFLADDQLRDKVTDSLAARAAGTEATVNPAPDSAGVPRATVSVPVLVTTIVPVVAAAGRTVPKSTLEALSWTLAPLAATAAA